MPFVWEDWNVSTLAERVVLTRCNYYDITSLTEKSFRGGSEAYYDEDNSLYYPETISQVPTLSIGTTDIDDPQVGIGVGSILYANDDRTYDYLFEASVIGREIEILVGPRGDPIANFRVVFVGVVSNVSFDRGSTLELQIRDKLELLNQPTQTDVFVVTGHTEQIMPLAYGNVLCCPFFQISAGPDTYQVATPGVNHVVNFIFANGLNTTASASVEIPAASTFRYAGSKEGQIRVWFDGVSDGGVFLQNLGEVVTHMLTRTHLNGDAILDISEIDTASLAAADLVITDHVSLYIGDNESVLETLERLMPLGYLYGFNRGGLFFIQPLQSPDGLTATQTLGEDDIIRNQFTIVQTQNPIWRMIVHYWPVVDKFTTWASATSPSTRDRYGKDYWGSTSTDDSSIKTVFKEAREKIVNLPFRTPLTDITRLFGLFSVRRRVYQVECWAKPLGFEIGDVVEVTYKRFGMENGTNLIFIGSENQLNKSRVTAYFWG